MRSWVSGGFCSFHARRLVPGSNVQAVSFSFSALGVPGRTGGATGSDPLPNLRSVESLGADGSVCLRSDGDEWFERASARLSGCRSARATLI